MTSSIKNHLFAQLFSPRKPGFQGCFPPIIYSWSVITADMNIQHVLSVVAPTNLERTENFITQSA